MSKSAEAFRTIGEVADELDVPKHVLRFWEGKFPHIRPMKRGGGRRYYRPEDMELLRGIRHLLHAEGYTIKGVQKILREQGIDQVKAAAAAGAAAAAAEKSGKGRGRGARSGADSAQKPAVLPPKSTEQLSAPQAKSADGARRLADGEAVPARVSTKDVIAAAIRELEMCRKLLLPAAAQAVARDAPRLKAARS